MKRKRYNPYWQKYHNHKVERDGFIFDSIKEANRYSELKLLEQAGTIQNLQRQVPFELIPAQYEPDIIGPRGGVKKGKLIEHKCTYVADFVYLKDDKLVVEDTKGMRLSDYIIKRKLMLYHLGIRITEI
ncbi:DUF1064 domain-containing protein [Butyrivibrio sp.]|uniref:DUF1064 domain-containing protein n=1 Tax=Butyrivibrio sp. TaxID=28121 RepID=UPI0025C0209E|nr:DUF1064 domain-containing protein [Butyrivibrio sp.]MBQ9303883.1 DUF1064 domain-containing protein [Butyrivibrio sp.]